MNKYLLILFCALVFTGCYPTSPPETTSTSTSSPDTSPPTSDQEEILPAFQQC